MTSGPGSSRPTSVALPGIEADPLFADAVDDAIAGDASTMPGVLDRPVGRDPHDFSSLYVRHRSSFVAHARRYLNDQRDIDEVVQEALLRLFLALPELETELQALSYCRRTVTNLCIDRFRAQARRPRLVGYDEATDTDLMDDGNIDDPIYAAEDAAIVREALALLSPTHRDALIKREVEEKSLAQIAAEMGIPETAVKHTLHRARRSLRRTLALLWAESGQGVKSALALILAILVSLPFISRGGSPTPSRTAALPAPVTSSLPLTTVSADTAATDGATGGQPSAGVNTAQSGAAGSVTPGQPGAPATPVGSAKWPTVPQLELSKPVLPPETGPADTNGAGAPKPPAVPPTPVPPKKPAPTPPATDEPKLSVLGTYTLVAAPSIAQKSFAQPKQSDTQVSDLQAATTDGDLTVHSSFTKFADGAMDVTLTSTLPVAGKSVATAIKRFTYSAHVNADRTVRVSVTSDVSIPTCDVAAIANASTVVAAQVHVDLQLTPDLASVIAESVVVTPTALAGSADAVAGCGGSTPASPIPPDGGPEVQLAPPSPGAPVKVEEQVTATF